MEDSDKKTDVLECARDLIDGLYKFKDEYLLKNGIESASKKNEDVGAKSIEVLLELDSLQLSINNKAVFFFLRGKVLNIAQEFDNRAVECLSKAIKLDPNLIDAWNELGECYWKNSDIDAASNCFKQANSKEKNKVSLRNLSMVQRQMGTDYNSKVENIKESVKTAKEAVAMDVSDGKSWYVLGNAYLSSFFFAGQNPSALKQCMIAYARSGRDELSLLNPDLHYNQAVAYKYQEDFVKAIKGYTMASQLDPGWSQPISELDDLKRRLHTSVELIKNKGKLKAKRLTTIMNSFKESDYGPFVNGTYVSPLNNTISLSRTSIQNLKPERNDNTVICCKVVTLIPVKETVPFPCLLMDSNGDFIAMSVFNLAADKGLRIGDTVAIPEPYVQMHETSLDTDEVLSFQSIRVDNPVVMVINKRKVGAERLAFSILSVTNKSE